ncbi:MAG: glucose-6-phosphate isomerase, partial [Shimia sp.]
MWDDLFALRDATADRHILDLMDGNRAEAFSIRADGLLFDYAKTNIDSATRDALLVLAKDVPAKRAAMFAGEPINETEGRAVLHTALRDPESTAQVNGTPVAPGVQATLRRMGTFAEAVRSGSFKGQGGAITDVVNIGIGGSDLGPAMAVLALAPYHDGPRVHFVSNIDGAHIADTLDGLDPATTLVIIASKTFTTIETMTNAKTAWDWMAGTVKTPGAQFAALSSAEDRTAEWGIAPARVFGFEDWVGGRYSLWGPIGLSLMLAIGPD